MREYIAERTSDIDHRATIKNVVTGAEISGSYLSLLLLASLIALLGLLTNSVAVVIGAMLISPLMGPILSFGLAFTIGDLALARRGLRVIAVSVGLTIALTAFVTLLSPLKEPTAEILSRVRPNIYDLFVAVLAGTAGAIALCTKKNYMITASGVAVATAVIPPLSVVGFGLGSGRIMLGLGGFLLFFTNFVAIVLASDLVFFLFNFHSSMVSEERYPARKRLLILGTVLVLLSIPLVHTLVTDLRKVKLAKRVERVLKLHLEKEAHSRVTGFSVEEKNGRIGVNVTVNTVRPYEKGAEEEIEREIGSLLGRSADLNLEQVVVTAGSIEQKAELPAAATVGQSAAVREESAASVQASTSRLLRDARTELEAFTAPFVVDDIRLEFGEKPGPAQVSIAIRRDYPLTDDERILLARLLERRLQVPVSLRVELVPFLSPVTFDEKGDPSRESIVALAMVKKLPGGSGALESEGPDGRRRADRLKRYLVEDLGVPAANVTVPAKPKSGADTAASVIVVRR
nr:TIGR00341 family protein [Geobacter grbiciae]